jgi:shikimate kinase
LITDGIESWKAIYQARKPIYEAVANVTIDTSSKPLAVILDEIKKELDS